MSKILIIDPKPDKQYRISKDTSGGYGTANDFGDTFFTNILKKTLKKIHDWPPMYVGYIFTILRNNGHIVTYSNEKDLDFEKFDFIILVSSIVCFETEIEILKKIKTIDNKIKVFIIGPFATNNADEYLLNRGIVVSGEPEFFFINENNFNAYEDGVLVESEKKISLDELPFPSWDKIIPNLKVSTLFGNEKTLPILATRGCPYSCFKYCVYPLQQGRTVRHRSPKNIVDELVHWKKNLNVRSFIFRDPVFSINKKHTIELCNEIIKRNLDIKFIIETHLRILDKNLVQDLKKAGLKGVKVGIESSNLEVLQDANRYTVTKDDQIEKVNFLEKNKIQVSAMYIIGYPEDNEKTIIDTLNYSIKLNTSYAQFAVWTPYPGTPVYKEYKDKIIANKFEDFTQYKLVFKHKNLLPIEIRELLSKCYSKYYLRYNWIKDYIKK